MNFKDINLSQNIISQITSENGSKLNKRIAELEEKLHMVLEDNAVMSSVVYHMPDPHALLEKIDFFK